MHHLMQRTLMIALLGCASCLHAAQPMRLLVQYCGEEANVKRSFKLGQAVTVCVYALDAQNNLVTDYRGNVGLKGSDTGAVLPTPHAFKTEDGGIFRFTVVFTSLGATNPPSQTIEVADSENGLKHAHTFFLTQ